MASSNGGVPPGFRFHPTDEELLHYYLKKKVNFQKFDMDVIREVDLNKIEPWDLQERCRIGSTPQNEWYFFSHKDRKYPTGSRTNRATNAGFWKATGRDKCIRNSFKKIGMRKTLVFYRGRAPHGHKTDWIMHEYRLEEADDAQPNPNDDGWVVCRVFKKKNLFKIGNEGSSTHNTDQHLHTSSSINQPRSFMHSRESQYLLLHQQNPRTSSASGFQLEKPELALHYTPPHLQNPQYSLFQAQSLLPPATHYTSYSSALPSDTPSLAAKQLMTNPASAGDCDSGGGGSEGLRYQVSETANMEVGTCEPTGHQEIGTTREDQGFNEWGMLDRLVVTSSSHHHHIGNEESSKGVRYEDANNPQSVHQINHQQQLSLRGEVDFWGYGKQ